jgi:arylsulfatase
VWDRAEEEEVRHWALYNLGTDPFEQNDVAKANPEKFQQLLAMWERYDEENGVIY